MCDCKSNIEARLVVRAKEMHPEALGHEVKLTGYAFILGETVQLKGAMPFEFRAEFPLKQGGLKRKVEKTSMMFTFCPFCGVKYDAPAETESNWVMHILGPDDVIDQPDEITALRQANQHNLAFARLMANDPSPNDPYCVAVAEVR